MAYFSLWLFILASICTKWNGYIAFILYFGVWLAVLIEHESKVNNMTPNQRREENETWKRQVQANMIRRTRRVNSK